MEIIVLSFLCSVASFHMHFSTGDQGTALIIEKIRDMSSQLIQLEIDVLEIETKFDDEIKLAQQHIEADLKTSFVPSYIQNEVEESLADILTGQNVEDMISGHVFEELNALRQSFRQFKVRFHDLTTHVRDAEYVKDNCLKETRKMYMDMFGKTNNEQIIRFSKQYGDINASLSLLQKDLKQIQRTLSWGDEERRRVQERLRDVTRKQEDLEEATSRMQVNLNKIQRDESQRSRDLRRFEGQIQHLMSRVEHQNEPVILFTAQLSARRKYSVFTTIVFDKVVTNTGGGYDSGSGYFTAPVSGFYEFSCTLQTIHSGASCFEIRDDVAVRAVLCIQRDWSTKTMRIIIHVDAGKKVWIWKNFDRGENASLREGVWSQFSGYLLRKD